MKIIIKKMVIVNFKGIKLLEIIFNHITNIFGENAAGKTTVFDAFTWTFFGKDSSDRKDSEFKPLDKTGKPIQKTDVEVAITIEANGKDIVIRKVLKEKWVKKRGELEPEFTGNENLFFWNDVPLQLKQFQEKVGELLNENIFKLITNPLYFNSLPWKERRSVLLEICGNITNEEIISANPSLKKLTNLLSDKSLEEFKREVSAKKKKLKDELSAIPTRISEVNHSIPETGDFEGMRQSLTEKLERINEIDEQLLDATKVMESAYTAKREQQNTLHDLKTTAANIKASIRSKFSNDSLQLKQDFTQLENQVASFERDIKFKKESIAGIEKDIERLTVEKTALAAEWENLSIKELAFDEKQFNCPACQRPLDATKIEETKKTLTENFNIDKAKKLDEILQKGTSLKNRITVLDSQITDGFQFIDGVELQIKPLLPQITEKKTAYQKFIDGAEAEFSKVLGANLEYRGAMDAITAMETEVAKPVEAADNTNLKSMKQSLVTEVDGLKRRLMDEEKIKQSTDRIDELQSQEGVYAQQLADLEGSEYLAEQFTKAKMETMIKKINGRFRHVSFKMFQEQINGGELEACETMVPNEKKVLVPFSDANNAARVNAGLDIINTLCEHYGVYAPIFVDNRESINNLIDCESQVVNLIVSTDKKLRVA